MSVKKVTEKIKQRLRKSVKAKPIGFKMKLSWIFATFVLFCVMQSSSREFNRNLLQKAFVNISEALARQDHFVSVFMSDFQSEKVKSALFASNSDVPRVVTKFNTARTRVGTKSSKVHELFSSAIVSLGSIASLKTFHESIILHYTYSISHQQLIIYCPDATYDKVKIKGSSSDDERKL